MTSVCCGGRYRYVGVPC